MAAPVRAPVLVSGADGDARADREALDALDPQGGRATAAARLRDRRGLGPVGPDGQAGRRRRRHRARRRSRRCATSCSAARRSTSSSPRRASPPSRCRPRPGRPARATRSSSPARTTLPAPTAAALKRHPKVPVYVLGPSSAISSEVVREIGKIAERVRRVSGEDPVANAIALRPLRRRRLRLEHQRPRPRLRRRPLRRAAGRGRRGAALGLGDLGAAAAHRQRRYASGRAARVPARRQAGLHDRSDARLLQPRLADRRPGGDRRERAGGNRRAGRAGQDRRRT